MNSARCDPQANKQTNKTSTMRVDRGFFGSKQWICASEVTWGKILSGSLNFTHKLSPMKGHLMGMAGHGVLGEQSSSHNAPK